MYSWNYFWCMYCRFWPPNIPQSLTFRLLCSTRVWNEYSAVCWTLLVKISLSSQIQWHANTKHNVWSGNDMHTGINTAISLYMHTLKWWGPASCQLVPTSLVTLFFYLRTNPSHACKWQNYIVCPVQIGGTTQDLICPSSASYTSWQIPGISQLVGGNYIKLGKPLENSIAFELHGSQSSSL